MRHHNLTVDINGTVVGYTPIAETGDHMKKDYGKSPWFLLPFDALKELADLYGVGAAKYAPRLWEEGMDYSRMYGSLMRHLTAWWQDGETHDIDTGKHHLTAVAWCTLGLLAYELRGIGNDDRPGRHG